MEIFIPSTMICGTRKLIYMITYTCFNHILASFSSKVVRQNRILKLYVVHSASHVCVQRKEFTLLSWYHGDYKMNDSDQYERLYIFWSSTSETLKELSPHRQVLQVLALDNAHLENIHSTRL